MKKFLRGFASSLKQIVYATSATFFLLLTSFSLLAQPDTWQYTGDNGIYNRAYPISFSINGKGYLGTGRDDGLIGRELYNDFWEFNPTTHVWTQKADVPGPKRSEATGFSIGNKGYVGCGRGNFSLQSNFPFIYDDFWEYDPATNTWTQKASLAPAGGLPRSRAVGFSIGNKGYLGTGGFTLPTNTIASIILYFTNINPILKTVLNAVIPNVPVKLIDFWEYNPATDKWTRLNDFSGSARDAAVGFSIGQKGYVGSGPSDDFWEYDPAIDKWTQKTNVGIGANKVNSGFSIGNKGYICSEANFREYDPVTNTWTTKANFPGPGIAAATGFSIGSKGYIGFGETSDYYPSFPPNTLKRPTNRMYEYNPVPYIYITSISSHSVNAGSLLAVTFNAIGTFNAGNSFVVQLSNAGGNFSTPTIIGSAASGGTVNVTVPACAVNGSGYRVRVISSSPAITGSDNGENINIMSIPPVIKCNSDIVVNAAKGLCGAVVNYNPPVLSDKCGNATVTMIAGLSSGTLFPVGTTTNRFVATNPSGQKDTCSFTVTVLDKEPPVITQVSASPSSLWPANHQMKDINIYYTALDNCGPVNSSLSVTSNEPVSGTGDGDTSPDWIILNDHHVQLRAERSGRGNGRMYTITITSTDTSGNISTQTTQVVVPHNSNGKMNYADQLFDCKVIPNPSSQYFELQVNSGSNEKIEVNLYDINGKFLSKMNAVKNQALRFGSNLRPGTYMVEVIQGQHHQRIFVIKK